MTEKKQQLVKFIKIHRDAQLPTYADSGASGMDLSICERVTIGPLERKVVTTGLKIKIKKGYEGQVRPRSGNAANKGITVLNSPGTIDNSYSGELKVILYNSNKDESVSFMCPDRIAQLVISPVIQCKAIEVSSFDEEDITERGEAGFGSTGL